MWIAGGVGALAVLVGALVVYEQGGLSNTATVDQPKAEKKVEAPKTEVQKVEAPKVETPKVEAKTEAPKVETPKVAPPVGVAGQLSVTTTPPGATLWIDGEARGQSPLTWPAPAGPHRVIAVLSGYRLVQKSVTSEAQGSAVALTLEPAKLPAEVAGPGGLKVRCHTLNELRILVDGHDTGLTCPNDARINVAPGEHKIGLQSPRTGEIKELDGSVGDDADHSTRIYSRF
jgi:hypothetical protein